MSIWEILKEKKCGVEINLFQTHMFFCQVFVWNSVEPVAIAYWWLFPHTGQYESKDIRLRDVGAQGEASVGAEDWGKELKL